jgi:cell division protein FtsQ
MMRQILIISGHLTAAALLIGLLSFAQNRNHGQRISALHIEIDHSEGMYFVDNNQIDQLIRRQNLYRDSMALAEFNPSVLEQRLLKHPHIKNVEVFIDARQHLHIKVWQRTPILRVINRWQEHCYIDSDRRAMYAGSGFTANVPVASGYISHRPKLGDTLLDAQLLLLTDLAERIQNDPWLSALIVQLYADTTGAVELIPRLGGARILLGDTTRWAAKTAKLKEFCRQSNSTGGLNAWSTINLSYKNQLVCQK